MSAYIRGLANKVPVGTKAAQVQANQAAVGRLYKLGSTLARSNDLFQSIRLVYPTKSAAYHCRVFTGLVRGMTASNRLPCCLGQPDVP
ncbi:MAG: hypothetical protein K8T91_15510 [Planctomycetes bacterium]|nr:hypothetical protein [Planctomycetota bacterium]